MVNNYPEYAAGVNFKKTDSNGVRHFYSAQVVADPSDETIESKLIKDGVVISEGGPTVEALNVTENGTYSEEGKAYSPVVVNVAGGSSDFSTAEVTFSNTTDTTLVQNGIAVLNFMGEEGMAMEFPILTTDPITVDVVLFKGSQIIFAPTDDVTIAVTGDITENEGEIVVTGDGTISYTTK